MHDEKSLGPFSFRSTPISLGSSRTQYIGHLMNNHSNERCSDVKSNRFIMFEYLRQLWIPGMDAITIATAKRKSCTSLSVAEAILIDLHEGRTPRFKRARFDYKRKPFK